MAGGRENVASHFAPCRCVFLSCLRREFRLSARIIDRRMEEEEVVVVVATTTRKPTTHKKKKRREERYYIRRQTKKPQGVHIPKSSRCSFFSLFYCATLKVLFFFRFIQESMMTFCARAELCLKFKWQQWCRVELISPVAFAFAFSLSPSLSLSLSLLGVCRRLRYNELNRSHRRDTGSSLRSHRIHHTVLVFI